MPQRWAPAATPQQIRYMAPANRASAKGLMMATAVAGAVVIKRLFCHQRRKSKHISERTKHSMTPMRTGRCAVLRPAVDQVGPDDAEDYGALNQFPHDRHRCGPASKQRRHTDLRFRQC